VNLRGGHPREEPEINFIPLIDVLLVILIFLMVTTTYQRVAELQITLPEADADQMKQRPKEINVGIDAQGQYALLARLRLARRVARTAGSRLAEVSFRQSAGHKPAVDFRPVG